MKNHHFILEPVSYDIGVLYRCQIRLVRNTTPRKIATSSLVTTGWIFKAYVRINQWGTQVSPLPVDSKRLHISNPVACSF